MSPIDSLLYEAKLLFQNLKGKDNVNYKTNLKINPKLNDILEQLLKYCCLVNDNIDERKTEDVANLLKEISLIYPVDIQNLILAKLSEIYFINPFLNIIPIVYTHAEAPILTEVLKQLKSHIDGDNRLVIPILSLCSQFSLPKESLTLLIEICENGLSSVDESDIPFLIRILFKSLSAQIMSKDDYRLLKRLRVEMRMISDTVMALIMEVLIEVLPLSIETADILLMLIFKDSPINVSLFDTIAIFVIYKDITILMKKINSLILDWLRCDCFPFDKLSQLLELSKHNDVWNRIITSYWRISIIAIDYVSTLVPKTMSGTIYAVERLICDLFSVQTGMQEIILKGLLDFVFPATRITQLSSVREESSARRVKTKQHLTDNKAVSCALIAVDIIRDLLDIKEDIGNIVLSALTNRLQPNSESLVLLPVPIVLHKFIDVVTSSNAVSESLLLILIQKLLATISNPENDILRILKTDSSKTILPNHHSNPRKYSYSIEGFKYYSIRSVAYLMAVYFIKGRRNLNFDNSFSVLSSMEKTNKLAQDSSIFYLVDALAALVQSYHDNSSIQETVNVLSFSSSQKTPSNEVNEEINRLVIRCFRTFDDFAMSYRLLSDSSNLLSWRISDITSRMMEKLLKDESFTIIEGILSLILNYSYLTHKIHHTRVSNIIVNTLPNDHLTLSASSSFSLSVKDSEVIVEDSEYSLSSIVENTIQCFIYFGKCKAIGELDCNPLDMKRMLSLISHSRCLIKLNMIDLSMRKKHLSSPGKRKRLQSRSNDKLVGASEGDYKRSVEAIQEVGDEDDHDSSELSLQLQQLSNEFSHLQKLNACLQSLQFNISTPLLAKAIQDIISSDILSDYSLIVLSILYSRLFRHHTWYNLILQRGFLQYDEVKNKDCYVELDGQTFDLLASMFVHNERLLHLIESLRKDQDTLVDSNVPDKFDKQLDRLGASTLVILNNMAFCFILNLSDDKVSLFVKLLRSKVNDKASSSKTIKETMSTTFDEDLLVHFNLIEKHCLISQDASLALSYLKLLSKLSSNRVLTERVCSLSWKLFRSVYPSRGIDFQKDNRMLYEDCISQSIYDFLNENSIVVAARFNDNTSKVISTFWYHWWLRESVCGKVAGVASILKENFRKLLANTTSPSKRDKTSSKIEKTLTSRSYIMSTDKSKLRSSLSCDDNGVSIHQLLLAFNSIPDLISSSNAKLLFQYSPYEDYLNVLKLLIWSQAQIKLAYNVRYTNKTNLIVLFAVMKSIRRVIVAMEFRIEEFVSWRCQLQQDLIDNQSNVGSLDYFEDALIWSVASIKSFINFCEFCKQDLFEKYATAVKGISRLIAGILKVSNKLFGFINDIARNHAFSTPISTKDIKQEVSALNSDWDKHLKLLVNNFVKLNESRLQNEATIDMMQSLKEVPKTTFDNDNLANSDEFEDDINSDDEFNDDEFAAVTEDKDAMGWGIDYDEEVSLY